MKVMSKDEQILLDTIRKEAEVVAEVMDLDYSEKSIETINWLYLWLRGSEDEFSPEIMANNLGQDAVVRGFSLNSNYEPEIAIKLLGSYLGQVIVKNLKCRWIAKKKLFGGFKTYLESESGYSIRNPHDAIGATGYLASRGIGNQPIHQYLEIKAGLSGVKANDVTLSPSNPGS